MSNKDEQSNCGYRADLEGRLPIVYNGKSAKEWYTLYCQIVLAAANLLDSQVQVRDDGNIEFFADDVKRLRKALSR